MAMDFTTNLLILFLLSLASSQTLAHCPCFGTPTVGPVPLPPVPIIGKPPITLPPIIGKPPITLPPVIGKPPITLPPVIGKPPITLPPVIGKPPITLPPVIGKPPITLPPVIGKPPITIPVIGNPPSTPKFGCPTPPVPTPAPTPAPAPAPSSCPADTLKLGLCLDVLGAPIQIGDPAVGCCPLIEGLASIQAAECLCTAIKLNALGLDIFVPIALKLLVTCGKTPPAGYNCA